MVRQQGSGMTLPGTYRNLGTLIKRTLYPHRGFTGEANFTFPVWQLRVKLSIDNPPGPVVK